MTGAPLLVFYDGECGLCAGVMVWALRRDRRHALRPMAVQSAEAQRLLGPARATRALEELHTWSDREGVRTGVEAVAALLARLPRWRRVAPLLSASVPLTRPFYRWIASRRRGLGAAQCALPVPPLSSPPPAAPRPPHPPRSHRS